MRMPILLAVVLLVLWASVANAALDYALTQKYVDKYNGKVDAAPSALRDLLGSERISLDVTLENGSAFKAGFEMSNARIVKMYPGGIPNPTIDICTTENAINSMAGSKDKITAFRDAMNSGQVEITSQNLFTRIKLGVMLSSMGVLKFFNALL